MEKRNITTIIHDIKEQYAKKFHEKIPQTPEMERVIIEAARKVKQGAELEWYTDEKTGNKKVKITFVQRKTYEQRKAEQELFMKKRLTR